MTDEKARAAIARWQRAGHDVTPGERARLVADVNDVFAAQDERTYATCLRFVGRPERARELAQDVLLVAWARLGDFDHSVRFSTWLFGIARNVCRREIERKAELLTIDGVVEAGSTAAGTLSELLRAEREEVLQAAIAELEPDAQEALYLRYIAGLPRDEIERILGLDSSSGARGLLQKAMRHLKIALPARLAELGHGRSFLSSRA